MEPFRATQSTISSEPTHIPTNFFHLPIERRKDIYQLVIADFEINTDSSAPAIPSKEYAVPLLNVCTQFRQEALKVYADRLRVLQSKQRAYLHNLLESSYYKCQEVRFVKHAIGKPAYRRKWEKYAFEHKCREQRISNFETGLSSEKMKIAEAWEVDVSELFPDRRGWDFQSQDGCESTKECWIDSEAESEQEYWSEESDSEDFDEYDEDEFDSEEDIEPEDEEEFETEEESEAEDDDDLSDESDEDDFSDLGFSIRYEEDGETDIV